MTYHLPQRSEFSIQADPLAFRHASAWLDCTGKEWFVPPDVMHRLDICLNEILANIISHGGDGVHKSSIDIRFNTTIEGVLRVAILTVYDSGVAFDPTHVTLSRQPQNLADATPGGLGLVMLRSNADHLKYRYYDGRNELQCEIAWPVGDVQ